LNSNIQSLIQKIPQEKTLWVAYSGGVDSHALLHFLSQQSFPHKIRAVHVNHGLSQFAASWTQHCQKVCDDLYIPLTVVCVDARAPKGKSPEEYAREQRYDVLKKLLTSQDVLLLAHHQDDQSETLLLQLCRGGGLPGLAAMSEGKKLGEITLLRPLLFSAREEILNYAHCHQLNWIEDDSNENVSFNRNYLRHKIFPLLKARWPSISRMLSRTASHCSDAQQLLNELAEMDFAQGNQDGTVSISGILKLSKLRCMNVLRYWIRKKKFLLPSEIQLHEIVKTLLLSRRDAMPEIILPNFVLRRYRDDLYLLPLGKNKIEENVFCWEEGQTLLLPGYGKLIPKKEKELFVQRLFISKSRFDKNYKLTVRFREGGERFHPAGRLGSHPLKKLLQEWGVPPWERSHIPLVYVNDALACVVGKAVSIHFMKNENKPEEEGTYIDFLFERE